jgi:hypothetical protein
MTPLDPRHPLWQFHLVEDYEGGSALVARIHHCIGDGIALISVMMSITDGGSDPPKRRKKPRTRRRRRRLAQRRRAQALTELTAKAIGMYGGGKDARRHAGQPAAAAAGQHGHGAHRLQVVNDVAALALMPDDSPTLLKGKPKGRKVVAWSEPMPLDDVKTVGKGLGCTVNDVLLSCVAGAIGEYLLAQGRPGGQGDPRDGAGEPAPAGKGLEAGQPLRPGAAGAADRHRQPGRARLRRAPAHERAQGQLPAAAGLCACCRSAACSSSRCRTPSWACSPRRPPR